MQTHVVAPLAAIVIVALSALAVPPTPAARPSPPAAPRLPGSQRPSATTAKSVAAANAFLSTLDDRQRARALAGLTEATRSNWSNLPTGVRLQSGAAARNGLKLGELSAAQQEAALALVAAPLSASGFQKVMGIVAADQVLEDRTAPSRGRWSTVRFGRGEYHLAILGTPSSSGPWMIQFGGHHLAVNVTVVRGSHVLTPSHTGAQPAVYTLNGQTVRPLGHESDRAFALVNALDEPLRKQAVLPYRVNMTVLGPGLDGRTIEPEGARVADFDAGQRRLLLDLVREWVGILSDDAAKVRMSEIEARLDDTYFAWSGATTTGASAYFRIQGPTVAIEYAPQGSTDHIHTFYRDPTNDYGEGLRR
jgi:hypothetical protein